LSLFENGTLDLYVNSLALGSDSAFLDSSKGEDRWIRFRRWYCGLIGNNNLVVNLPSGPQGVDRFHVSW